MNKSVYIHTIIKIYMCHVCDFFPLNQTILIL